MFTLIARIQHFLAPTRTEGDDNLAHALMESAGNRGGHDAADLREAAYAWLRVVR